MAIDNNHIIITGGYDDKDDSPAVEMFHIEEEQRKAE